MAKNSKNNAKATEEKAVVTEVKDSNIVDSVEALEAKLAQVREAQKKFSTYTQEQVDKIFKAAAIAANQARIPLAKQAVEETFKKYLEEKKLEAKDIFQFKYNIVVSKNDPLALKSSVTTEDLSNYIIISHADPYVPSLPAHDLQKEDMGYNNERHIFVYERASQLELLSKVKNTCMFVSPMPKHLLNIYGLKEIKCSDKVGMYKDVLIYRKKQKLDSFDELFINQLENSIKEH